MRLLAWWKDESHHQQHRFPYPWLRWLHVWSYNSGDQRVPIKKPWRIVSWGVKFSLNKKCDRNHDHGKCEGRETRVTQTYTCQIVDIILKTVRRQMTIRFKESLLMLDNACSSCKHDRRSAKKIAVSTINNTSEVALDLSDEVCQMVMYQSCQPRKLRLSINTRSIVHDIIDFIIFDHRRKSDRKPVCGTATGSTWPRGERNPVRWSASGSTGS